MLGITHQWHSKDDDIATLNKAIKSAQRKKSKSILILACSDNNITTSDYDTLLSSISLPLFGGIYPRLIFNKKVIATGFVVIGFSDTLEIYNFQNISDRITNNELTENEIEEQIKSKSQAYFLFHDAFSPNSEDFIEALYYCLGNVKIIGGGAGSLDFIQRPCVFSNEGVLEDATQLVPINTPLSLGVSHGWQVLAGPYLVTETNQHEVRSLNYESAFQTYKNDIEKLTDYKFNNENFFDVAKSFPLGIQGANNDEILVRDPIQTIDDNLECVGNVPVNSMVYILKGNKEDLVRSVEIATLMTYTNQQSPTENLFVVDCISRYLFLDYKFKHEINAMVNKFQPPKVMFGVLALGEISNSHSGAIKLLNKSTVLGAF